MSEISAFGGMIAGVPDDVIPNVQLAPFDEQPPETQRALILAAMDSLNRRINELSTRMDFLGDEMARTKRTFDSCLKDLEYIRGNATGIRHTISDLSESKPIEGGTHSTDAEIDSNRS